MKSWKTNYASIPWQPYVVCIFALLVLALIPDHADQIPGIPIDEALNANDNTTASSVIGESANTPSESGADVDNTIAFTFQKLVDTNVKVPPDKKLKFSEFGPPAISVTQAKESGGLPSIAVAYVASAVDESGRLAVPGVYVNKPSVGDPVRVVDTTKKPPDGGFFFSFGEAPAIEGGFVAFFSSGIQGSGQTGLYTSAPPYRSYSIVADQNTPIPDGKGNFTGFLTLPAAALSERTLAFSGAGVDNQLGVYIGIPGKLGKVADKKTNCPSGGKFVGFANVSMSKGKVAFRGNVDLLSSGIYTGDSEGDIKTLADKTIACPQGNGMKFSGADRPSINDGQVAFVGYGCNEVGVYSGAPGSLNVVADTTTKIPDGTGRFTSFLFTAQSGKNVAFKAVGEKQVGIYLWVDGSLLRVVDRNTKLDGQAPADFGFIRNGLDGAYLAFQVTFEDKTSAIYLASPKK